MRFKVRHLLLTFQSSALVLSGCTAATSPVQTSPETGSISERPLTLGTTYEIPSDVFGTPREINVYAPELPAWGEGYFETPIPLLYLVDGGRDQDFIHIAGLSQLTLVNGERQPMIVVGVKTENRRQEIVPDASDPHYQTSEFVSWGGSKLFRKHLTEEVMPFIRERYEGGREVLAGESLAGLFVLETFLEAPDSFDDYIAVSPSLWWDDRHLAKASSSLLENHKANDHRLYLTMADEGGTMKLGLDEFRAELNTALHPPTVKYVDRSADDTHASIYHHAMRDALGWLYGIEAKPYGETPWYLIEGGQPPE